MGTEIGRGGHFFNADGSPKQHEWWAVRDDRCTGHPGSVQDPTESPEPSYDAPNCRIVGAQRHGHVRYPVHAALVVGSFLISYGPDPRSEELESACASAVAIRTQTAYPRAESNSPHRLTVPALEGWSRRWPRRPWVARGRARTSARHQNGRSLFPTRGRVLAGKAAGLPRPDAACGSVAQGWTGRSLQALPYADRALGTRSMRPPSAPDTPARPWRRDGVFARSLIK